MAAASLAGVAPYSAAGLDWLDGMAAENLAEFEAAKAGEEALTAFLSSQAPGLAGVQGDQIAAALGELVSEVDRKALTDRFADYMAASCRGAVSGGIADWRDDDLAFVRDWGFDLSAFNVPVAVWQGGLDRMVPFAHGRWLADRLPGAAVHLDPAEGHLSLVLNAFDDIVAELMAHLP
jgi:pimeloyl-ACP methyl ester carboxylesterase